MSSKPGTTTSSTLPRQICRWLSFRVRERCRSSKCKSATTNAARSAGRWSTLANISSPFLASSHTCSKASRRGMDLVVVYFLQAGTADRASDPPTVAPTSQNDCRALLASMSLLGIRDTRGPACLERSSPPAGPDVARGSCSESFPASVAWRLRSNAPRQLLANDRSERTLAHRCRRVGSTPTARSRRTPRGD